MIWKTDCIDIITEKSSAKLQSALMALYLAGFQYLMKREKNIRRTMHEKR